MAARRVRACCALSRGSLRGARRGVRRSGVVASVVVMATTYGPGDPLRAYYGTDARDAHDPDRRAARDPAGGLDPERAARQPARVSPGIAAFVVMMFAWHVATGTSPRYYHGGSVAVRGARVRRDRGCAATRRACGQLLGIAPLAWIGRLSYGLYLFHWPIIVWLVPHRVHLDGLALNVLRARADVRRRDALLLPDRAPDPRAAPPVAVPSEARRRAPFVPNGEAASPAATQRQLAIVFASVPAPASSYLSGTQTPSFSFSTSGRDSATTPSVHSTGGRTSRSRRPSSTSSGHYGDPLFCGEPRARRDAGGRRRRRASSAHRKLAAAGDRPPRPRCSATRPRAASIRA